MSRAARIWNAPWVKNFSRFQSEKLWRDENDNRKNIESSRVNDFGRGNLCRGLLLGVERNGSGNAGYRAVEQSEGMKQTGNMAGMEGMSGMQGMSGMTSGMVMVSPEKQQLLGVRTAVVERKPLIKSVRTVGVIGFDETKVTHIHSKIEGWIDKL